MKWNFQCTPCFPRHLKTIIKIYVTHLIKRSQYHVLLVSTTFDWNKIKFQSIGNGGGERERDKKEPRNNKYHSIAIFASHTWPQCDMVDNANNKYRLMHLPPIIHRQPPSCLCSGGTIPGASPQGKSTDTLIPLSQFINTIRKHTRTPRGERVWDPATAVHTAGDIIHLINHF